MWLTDVKSIPINITTQTHSSVGLSNPTTGEGTDDVLSLEMDKPLYGCNKTKYANIKKNTYKITECYVYYNGYN